MTKRNFEKCALSSGELITFLQERGLQVADREFAEHCLDYIGFYRLKIYMRPYEDDSKVFRSGVTFEEIVELYDFDRKFRLLCLDAIERVEVALRSHIINIMGRHGGPHFYYIEEFFENKDAVTRMRQLGENGKHLSITHYKRTYEAPFLPPIWCLTEASTFGQISKLFADLDKSYRKEISAGFKQPSEVCVSWFRTISTLRNICAHHNRLWNAELAVNTPKKAKAYSDHLNNNRSFYAWLVVLRVLLGATDPNGHAGWINRLINLISEAPEIASLEAMGFPTDWSKRDVWKTIVHS